jgi:NAD(P)-dependent dehydrogenase (short-subunit alcohol dehydrogenase family)
MAETRVALVTGANRGIGFEVARQLARLGIMTVLGSRSLDKGKAAAEPLAAEGLVAPVVALDVTDQASVRAAVAETMGLFGRIDILVNNAGVMLDRSGTPNFVASTIEAAVVRATFDVNVLGPLAMSQAVLPIMRDQGYGRIVNVSSGMGQLSEMGAEHPAYRMSKAALNALTRTLAAELGEGAIKVNSMCPGWVKTDLGGSDAPRTVEQGAETAVWLAMLPDDGPSGGFFRDKKPIAW